MPRSVMIPVTKDAGGHVEGRIEGGHARRMVLAHLLFAAFLDSDLVSGFGVRIEGGGRAGHIEGYAKMTGQHGQV